MSAVITLYYIYGCPFSSFLDIIVLIESVSEFFYSMIPEKRLFLKASLFRSFLKGSRNYSYRPGLELSI